MVELGLTIIIVALSLYVTIFLHEWGHYVVAKRLKVPIQSINIGIGKILLTHTLKNNVPINIRLMPIGGFLNIPDMDFFRKTGLPAKHRILITLAGPIANFAFCLYIAVLLSLIGIPMYANSNIIGFVHPDVMDTGLLPGDRVVEAYGRKVKNWNAIKEISYDKATTNIPVIIERQGKLLTNSIPVYIRGIGVPVMPISAAQALYYRPAPLQKIRITAVNGSRYFNGDTFALAMKSNITLQVTTSANGEIKTSDWTITERTLQNLWEDNPVVIHANPLLIIGGTTYQVAKGVLAIISPHSNVSILNMSGPMTTMLYLFRYFATDFRLGLFLLMAINLNLALFNLVLPCYPLDGAHLLYAWLQETNHLLKLQKAMILTTWGIMFVLAFLLFIDIIKFATL